MTKQYGRRWILFVACGAVLALVVWASYEVALRVGIRSLRVATSHRLDLYTANLQAEMDRFEYLPPIIGLNEHVLALLEKPGDAANQARVNQHLQTVNTLAGASAIYVMNHQGLTLAASNWNQPASFVNMNFAYRPYFQDAAKSKPGRFYGVGTVSREAGYYFACAISGSQGTVLGVAAVKVNLERLDHAWRSGGEKIAVADSNGVVFLSSEPNWKYRTIRSLSSETLGRLAETRQYTEAGLLSPLGLKEQRVMDDGTAIVQVMAEPIEHLPARSAVDYLVQGMRVPGTEWRLLMFSELKPARDSARLSAALAGLTVVLGAMLVLYFQQRRRFFRQAVAARSALEYANDELERKVTQRTEALQEANQELEGEVLERKRAEETLRATLQDLVHTSRMAVLGQMSASITHELNQPLAALRTLSGNAIVFLERGQQGEAASNLKMIAQLTDHMGKLTSQLKKFARKSSADLLPVYVATVLADALFLLGQSTRIREVNIEQDLSPDLQALGDANRLEQVLLNLLTNALDAVTGEAQPHIVVTGRLEGDWVRLEVHDNGGGIPEAVKLRLFEPFFSTKEPGLGLGLGLAISSDIVRQFGGSLSADASALLGGAVFTVLIRAPIRTSTEPEKE